VNREVSVVERPEVTIHIGQVYATREAVVIKTILGSCIAACLMDPVARVGGMNHFMLPAPSNGSAPADGSVFGVHAMDLLIGAIQKAGGDRRRIQAKLFGGGHVLRMGSGAGSVPDRNIQFIEEFVRTERITVVSRDLGGYLPRRIQFYTDTGKVLVKRLGQHMIRQSQTEEKEHMRALTDRPAAFGEVTWFTGDYEGTRPK
jgi:chemotaxis protein CheD